MILVHKAYNGIILFKQKTHQLLNNYCALILIPKINHWLVPNQIYLPASRLWMMDWFLFSLTIKIIFASLFYCPLFTPFRWCCDQITDIIFIFFLFWWITQRLFIIIHPLIISIHVLVQRYYILLKYRNKKGSVSNFFHSINSLHVLMSFVI